MNHTGLRYHRVLLYVTITLDCTFTVDWISLSFDHKGTDAIWSTVSMQFYLTNNSQLFRQLTIHYIQQGREILYLGDTDGLIAGENTVLFNPSQEDRYVPWNPVYGNPSELADTFLDTYYEGQQSAGSSYYRHIEHLYLTAAFAVLIENDCNLIHLPYFLTHENYRFSLLENMDDLFVRDFWLSKFDHKDIASIYAKVYSLLINPQTRRIFSSNRNYLTGDVVLADINLPYTEKRVLSSLLAAQTDKMVIVENVSDISETVLLRLLNDKHDVLLSFTHRDQISEELHSAITGHCINLNGVTEGMYPIEPVEIDEEAFWKQHNRKFTRSNEKADKDFDLLMQRLRCK